jgi:hypothetical protein
MRLWARRRKDPTARTRVANRLHAVLLELVPGGYAGEIYAARAARVLEALEPAGAVASARVELATELLGDVARLDGQLKEPKEAVFLYPVRVEVPVGFLHHVVIPPQPVDAEGKEGGHDPARIILLALDPAGVRRRQLKTETPVDKGEFVLDADLGSIMFDQVLVQKNKGNNLGDAASNNGQYEPDDRLPKIAGHLSEHRQV